MQFSDINPYVRYVRKVSSRGANFGLSRNYDCRLFFFTNWKGSILIGDREHKLSPNDVLFLPPASCYQLICEINDAEIYVLCLDLDRSHSDVPDEFYSVLADTFDQKLVLTCASPEELSHPIIVKAPNLIGQFECCYDELRFKPLYFRENTSGVVKQILAEMLRKTTISDSESNITSSVLEYIRANYGNANLSNESIAKYFDYHPNYLNRVLKMTTGKSLHKCIIEYRVEKAKSKLTSDKLEIATIAELCGFTSASYFIKVFRAECGITPTAYRRKYSMII